LTLKAGVHPKIVQERLGHGSITVKLDIYSHAVSGLQDVVTWRLEGTLYGEVLSLLTDTGLPDRDVSNLSAEGNGFEREPSCIKGRTFSERFELVI